MDKAVSSPEFEAIQETVEVLQDADLMESLRQSAADVKAGRVKSWKILRRERGLA